MKRILFGGITLASLTLASMAYAYGHHHGDEAQDGGRHGHNRIVKQLELTEAQKAEFDAIHAQLRESLGGRPKLVFMKDIMALDPASADYAEQVAALAEKKAEEVKTSIKAMGETQAQVYGILTPEQRLKAKALHEEFKTKMETKSKKHHWH